MIPLLGGLFAVGYMLTRDVVWYQFTRRAEWRGSSFGKRLLGLQVVTLDGRDLDWITASLRNLPLVVGSILLFVPVIGPFIAPLVGVGFTILELVFTFVDADGRRLGDRLAGTQVVASQRG